MIDILLLLLGLALVATGLWWMWPPLCLVALGILFAVVAYFRWKVEQDAAKSAKQSGAKQS